MNKEAKILIVIATLVVIGGVILYLKEPVPVEPSKPVDSQSLIREGSHMTGSKSAKVTLVEFGDFQCPACYQAEPVVQKLIADYKDNPNFNFVFRNFPLTQIHKNAQVTAEAAESAGAQGKYWEMHNKIYEAQSEWSESPNALDFLVGYAQGLGLDTGKFKQDIEQHIYASVVSADASDGIALGVNATPTFYINGEKQTTFKYEDLKANIEAKLK